MRTITVNLPDDVAEQMDRHLAQGQWPSADDMVACGLVQVSDEVEAQRSIGDELRHSLIEALHQSERDECSDGDEFMDGLIESCASHGSSGS